ncbi:hypothetical protein ACFVZD_06900 [Streptomyces sp. NPDC058287]|uniref:hypothetical protein n=1 Tax=unclassified Streptomyces TaxID=2593676 RepID=UPI0036EB353D
MPDCEVRLRRQIVKLKELRQEGARELTQLRADVEHLVRVVNQITLENRQLREALSQHGSRLGALPTRPDPSQTPDPSCVS